MEAWRWREFLLLLTAFVFSVGFASGGFLLLLVLAAGEIMAGKTERRGTALWSAVAFWASATVPRIHISVGLFALVGLGAAFSSASHAVRQEEEAR